jgi:hypothetical protein
MIAIHWLAIMISLGCYILKNSNLIYFSWLWVGKKSNSLDVININKIANGAHQ